MKRHFIYIFIIVTCHVITNMALADDVGITKARLIQVSEKSYILEADTTQPRLWAIKAPIFPDRFQVSELEYIAQSGWIMVRAKAITEGQALTARDKLLLPWMRNGVSLTVQWRDGTIKQGLFLRSLEGIHVPLRLLMETRQSLVQVCRDHFLVGLKHLVFKGIHLLLVLALWSLLSRVQLINALIAYAFGQGVSLVATDLGLPGFDLLLADALGLVLIFLVAWSAVRQKAVNSFLVLTGLFGLLHGLAYAQALSPLALSIDQNLAVLFMFNLAIDGGHFTAAGILLLITRGFGAVKRWKPIGAYAAGTLSVALLAVVFSQHVLAAKTDVLAFDDAQIATRFALPAAQKNQPGGQRPKGARQLTNPVMSYLSVEPYEVRQEILIQARAAVQFLGVNDKGMGSIPLASLEPVKKGILAAVQIANPIFIDGQPATPSLTRADFVTLGPAGVIVRPNPIPESLDRGIIGLTLVYETPEMADEITIDWRLFSETVQKVEATTTDPFGGATRILSPEENRLNWKMRLSGYRVPVIEEVVVEKQQLPVISLLLFLNVILLVIFSIRRKRVLLGRPVLLSVVGLGFVLYPFLRFPVDHPFVTQWKPSTERTSTILDGLLTNVYRAFDVRDEDDVYDRLAMSVMGEQLAQIYLENRQSLEFENRGGARANVDEVDILAINKVTKSEGDGFVADAVWTVSGSVSHFGHTHYRRNRNNALVTFVIDGDSWKINDIELIDEKRLL